MGGGSGRNGERDGVAGRLREVHGMLVELDELRAVRDAVVDLADDLQHEASAGLGNVNARALAEERGRLAARLRHALKAGVR